VSLPFRRKGAKGANSPGAELATFLGCRADVQSMQVQGWIDNPSNGPTGRLPKWRKGAKVANFSPIPPLAPLGQARAEFRCRQSEMKPSGPAHHR
jgi:hypothetical protein